MADTISSLQVKSRQLSKPVQLVGKSPSKTAGSSTDGGKQDDKHKTTKGFRPESAGGHCGSWLPSFGNDRLVESCCTDQESSDSSSGSIDAAAKGSIHRTWPSQEDHPESRAIRPKELVPGLSAADLQLIASAAGQQVLRCVGDGQHPESARCLHGDGCSVGGAECVLLPGPCCLDSMPRSLRTVRRILDYAEGRLCLMSPSDSDRNRFGRRTTRHLPENMTSG